MADELREAEPIALRADYHPRVIEGGRRRAPKTASEPVEAGWPWVCRAYRFWVVYEGVLEWRHGQQRHRLLPGSVVLHAPDQVQAVMRCPPRSRWGQVRFELVPGLNGPQPGPQELWGVALPAILPEAMAKLARRPLDDVLDLWWRDRWSRVRAEATLAKLLVDLASFAHEAATVVRADRFTPVDALLARRPTASVAEMAAACDLPERTFRRQFHEARRRSPRDFAITILLQQARALLRDHQDLSIQEVARRLGYEHANVFIRRFRAEIGTTPQVWRQGMKG